VDLVINDRHAAPPELQVRIPLCCLYLHACMHACIHSYIHAYIHTYIHTYVYIHICLSLPAYARAHVHTGTANRTSFTSGQLRCRTRTLQTITGMSMATPSSKPPTTPPRCAFQKSST
jgi:hypothetical protein